jgi:hypothetical protein
MAPSARNWGAFSSTPTGNGNINSCAAQSVEVAFQSCHPLSNKNLRGVCLGSLADIRGRIRDVRFTPRSRHASARVARPLSAMCGRLLVGKGFLHVCSIGRCSHVFGLLARFA